MLMTYRAQENHQKSRFLQLPAEIRSEIYKNALGGETFEINKSGQMTGKEERKKESYLALTLVSRQVYVESVLIPFTTNTFQAETPQVLKTWARQLPIAAQEAIAQLGLSFDLHWHHYYHYTHHHQSSRETEVAGPFPDWWSVANNFEDFPGLRRVYLFTTLARCYCVKPEAETLALLKLLEEKEEAFKELVNASQQGTTGMQVDVVLKRDIDFAPLPSPGLIIGVEDGEDDDEY